jgi:hypothetical protein
MNNNKLIAEFMGVAGETYCYIPEHTLDIYDENGFFQEKSNHFQYNELKYHASWDWLMPVVNKIEDYLADNVGKVGYFDECLNSNDLEVRYQAVVEFIKQQKS